MKSLIIIFTAILLLFSSQMYLFSQELGIDYVFIHDTVIDPFENMEPVSEMKLEGEVTLNHDTSLVRVILQDEGGAQYMIMESYPLISKGSTIAFKNFCDETCFLDNVNPNSIIIQVIDASLNLSKLFYSVQPKESAEQQRFEAKRAKDAEKIEIMNQRIPAYGMNWISGDNGMVAKYYEQKRHMFGDGYNLLGFDYYKGGYLSL